MSTQQSVTTPSFLEEQFFKQRIYIETIEGKKTLFFSNRHGNIEPINNPLEALGQVMDRLKLMDACQTSVTAQTVWDYGRFDYDVSNLTHFSFITHAVPAIFADKTNLSLESVEDRNNRVAPLVELWSYESGVIARIDGKNYIVINATECLKNGYTHGQYRIKHQFEILNGTEKVQGEKYQRIVLRFADFTYI
jgi:hypothetical protein